MDQHLRQGVVQTSAWGQANLINKLLLRLTLPLPLPLALLVVVLLLLLLLLPVAVAVAVVVLVAVYMESCTKMMCWIYSHMSWNLFFLCSCL